MNKTTGRLTVFFEEPFWIGVFERVENGRLSVCRIIFGAEPRDREVYDFLLREYDRLPFSPDIADSTIDVAGAGEKRINPKRMQREIQRQLKDIGIGTKSQQALQWQREQAKAERKKGRQKRNEEEKQLRFQKKQQKRKEKHKGH